MYKHHYLKNLHYKYLGCTGPELSGRPIGQKDYNFIIMVIKKISNRPVDDQDVILRLGLILELHCSKKKIYKKKHYKCK